MFKNSVFIFTVIFFILYGLSVNAQKDVKGSKDHPIISRYEGSYIIGYEQENYDQLVMPAGPYDGDDTKKLTPEGKVTRILYAGPKGVSSFQVFKNYQRALRDEGFREIYNCDDNCYKFPWIFHEEETALDNRGDLTKHALAYDNTKDEKYLLTKMNSPEGAVYISVYSAFFTANYSSQEIKEEMKNRPVTLLQIVEEKSMATGKVQVNAEEMAGSLDKSGKVRLYGIHFDTDKATIKSDSEEILGEIASLLKDQPELKLRVVGHTDATGTYEYNMELSQKRAESVVNYLVDSHDIASERLSAHGVGSLAPVGANDSEEGRALNRRVELIKVYQ